MKHYIGIDLGGTNIAAGIVSETGSIISACSDRTDAAKPFEQLVSDISDTAYKALSISGLTISDVTAVGMGTPSCIDPKTGLLVNANNLNWRNVPLVSELQKHFPVPVFVQNDAACAALGEALTGAAAGYENAVMITLGTGVGSGIIMHRRIYNGCDSMGAEVGHTKLVHNGRPCTCGQMGCFEAYASATALIAQAREAAQKEPSSLMNDMCGGELMKMNAKIPFDAAKQGDSTALEVVGQYIDYLASGLSSVITLFRPQAVIIGGGISAEGEYLLGPLRKKLYRCTFAAEQIGIPDIIAAKLGNDAGIVGAAMQCVA